ncbi:ATP-grasp domain-containing protein [Mucilaginibacter psychrotolerans]|uniref:ATP-grasp fold RimK-type domain-containing protein n=1 Tax=Mucilaginibacter psychrotolerans TaxID=1524096 RepID=A0A4Y8SE31_9SPHI|nr:hypothetical protein [Mucilaginibacter psychrotolerans]TFF37289.1 hypothetical protein E2R66_12700 [Mucilaginibacter psychrotolerans]
MEKKRVLIVGLEPADVQLIRQSVGFDYLILHYDVLPKVQLVSGQLLAESTTVPGKFLLVDAVIFHGIYENDFDLITMLALWNGPCLPGARGMMDLRQRIPGLARALQVSRFTGIKRGMVINQDNYFSEKESVAKWGVWHCGEDKAKFTGDWASSETSVIEEFITGEAVRIMIIGDISWQIKLTGDTWLKSIHNEGSGQMDIDTELLADGKRIARHFGLEIVGIDYMVGSNGQKYLLEVNHIPNVTVFSFVNEAFIEFAKTWIAAIKLSENY